MKEFLRRFSRFGTKPVCGRQTERWRTELLLA